MTVGGLEEHDEWVEPVREGKSSEDELKGVMFPMLGINAFRAKYMEMNLCRISSQDPRRFIQERSFFLLDFLRSPGYLVTW